MSENMFTTDFDLSSYIAAFFSKGLKVMFLFRLTSDKKELITVLPLRNE